MAVNFGEWINFAGAGAGAGGGFLMVKWFLEYVSGRMDKRQAAIDDGTQHLIDNMQKQVDSLMKRLELVEKELAECRKTSAEYHAEAVELRAYMHGTGDAKQHAQMILSAERLIDKGANNERAPD